MDRDVTQYAIEEAGRRNDELVVLVALDPEVATKLASQFLESGSIGPRTSQGFLTSLSERHQQIATQAAEEIVREARSAGIEARAVIRRGEYDTETADVIRTERPTTVVVEKRRPSLFRFVAGDAFLGELAKKLHFELIEV